jgi:hypothetical protein
MLNACVEPLPPSAYISLEQRMLITVSFMPLSRTKHTLVSAYVTNKRTLYELVKSRWEQHDSHPQTSRY